MIINAQELAQDAFAPYGSFIDPRAHSDEGSISFQPDRMLYHIGGAIGSMCCIRMVYRPLVLTVTEYHDECEEVFGGFNCDTIFHVALLSGDNKPVTDSVRVFRLPAGCFARVKRRVLHHAAFVTKESDVACGVVLLSPAAYTIDCHVLNFDSPITMTL